jgi:DNA-directed RNA polymerase subunit RPC12/RpoP
VGFYAVEYVDHGRTVEIARTARFAKRRVAKERAHRWYEQAKAAAKTRGPELTPDPGVPSVMEPMPARKVYACADCGGRIAVPWGPKDDGRQPGACATCGAERWTEVPSTGGA